jgi:hypothetical protein
LVDQGKVVNTKLQKVTDNSFNLTTHVQISEVKSDHVQEHLIPLDKFSNFEKLIRVHSNVLQFVNILKSKLKQRDRAKFSHFSHLNPDDNFYELARNQIIRKDQQIQFPKCFEYFDNPDKGICHLPNIVGQLNLFLDNFGLLRSQSKCTKGKKEKTYFPSLLYKTSRLTTLVISSLHSKLFHAGRYTLIRELRKHFWIPHILNIVKSVVRECTVCNQLNNRHIKLNQNSFSIILPITTPVVTQSPIISTMPSIIPTVITNQRPLQPVAITSTKTWTQLHGHGLV